MALAGVPADFAQLRSATEIAAPCRSSATVASAWLSANDFIVALTSTGPVRVSPGVSKPRVRRAASSSLARMLYRLRKPSRGLKYCTQPSVDGAPASLPVPSTWSEVRSRRSCRCPVGQILLEGDIAHRRAEASCAWTPTLT